MKPAGRLLWPSLIAVVSLQTICAQDLSPRAFIITPIHSNAITLTWSFYGGSVEFDGVLPITNATATINVPVFSYYHSLNFFGRSANIVAAIPYGVGSFSGTLAGGQQGIYRSGLLDSTFRFSVNLKGGPAMPLGEFVKWREKTNIGASLKVVAPWGQYDSHKLINYGGNRWGFKPEIGYSRRWSKWVLDAYGGVWFFTANSQFYPGTNVQTERPVGSFEGHLSRDIKPRLWFSIDGNFWFGGQTSLNGIPTPVTTQRSSRVGVTASVPLTKHQSMKFSYSDGAYIRYGGNYNHVSLAWQYSWIGKPQ